MPPQTPAARPRQECTSGRDRRALHDDTRWLRAHGAHPKWLRGRAHGAHAIGGGGRTPVADGDRTHDRRRPTGHERRAATGHRLRRLKRHQTGRARAHGGGEMQRRQVEHQRMLRPRRSDTGTPCASARAGARQGASSGRMQNRRRQRPCEQERGNHACPHGRACMRPDAPARPRRRRRTPVRHGRAPVGLRTLEKAESQRPEQPDQKRNRDPGCDDLENQHPCLFVPILPKTANHSKERCFSWGEPWATGAFSPPAPAGSRRA